MDQTTYIYLDHAATTPLRSTAKEAMRPYEEAIFGNPLSIPRKIYQKLSVLFGNRWPRVGCMPEEILRAAARNLITVIKQSARDSRINQGCYHYRAIEHHAICTAVKQWPRRI